MLRLKSKCHSSTGISGTDLERQLVRGLAENSSGVQKMSSKLEISVFPTAPPEEDLNSFIKENLQSALSASVSVEPLMVLPSSIADRNRGQYDAEAILKFLQLITVDSSVYKLGLINEDCYTRGVKFVFGEAMLKGYELFVALPRLRESFYGRSENRPLFFQRVLKETVHELGHAFGLLHCPNQNCAMHFSAIVEQTDRKNGTFCSRCLSLLRQYESSLI